MRYEKTFSLKKWATILHSGKRKLFQESEQKYSNHPKPKLWKLQNHYSPQKHPSLSAKSFVSNFMSPLLPL